MSRLLHPKITSFTLNDDDKLWYTVTYDHLRKVTVTVTVTDLIGPPVVTRTSLTISNNLKY